MGPPEHRPQNPPHIRHSLMCPPPCEKRLSHPPSSAGQQPAVAGGGVCLAVRRARPALQAPRAPEPRGREQQHVLKETGRSQGMEGTERVEPWGRASSRGGPDSTGPASPAQERRAVLHATPRPPPTRRTGPAAGLIKERWRSARRSSPGGLVGIAGSGWSTGRHSSPVSSQRPTGCHSQPEALHLAKCSSLHGLFWLWAYSGQPAG